MFSSALNGRTSLKCWCTMPIEFALASSGPRIATRCAVDADLALVRRIEPGGDVHQRGLAGAVLAEQRVDLAGIDGEVRR